MNDHCETYDELMTQADSILDESDELLERALYLIEHQKISTDEWYRMSGEVTGMQNRYVELRDRAIEADHMHWMGQVEQHENEQYAKAAMLEEGLP